MKLLLYHKRSYFSYRMWDVLGLYNNKSWKVDRKRVGWGLRFRIRFWKAPLSFMIFSWSLAFFWVAIMFYLTSASMLPTRLGAQQGDLCWGNLTQDKSGIHWWYTQVKQLNWTNAFLSNATPSSYNIIKGIAYVSQIPVLSLDWPLSHRLLIKWAMPV